MSRVTRTLARSPVVARFSAAFMASIQRAIVVSAAERGHDPSWLLLRVYDDHQPTAWSYVLLEEPLPVRPGV